MGIYKNTNGTLSPIAGRGKAEYGASTVRTGTITYTGETISSYKSASATFDTPMPDADYVIELDYNQSAGHGELSAIGQFGIWEKTTAGFTIIVPPDALTGWSLTYTAFKLYTDNEYNNLLKITRPDLWPENTEIDFGNGLYGKRFTGTWNGAGTNTLLDSSIKSPSCKLQNYKVWQQRTTGDRLQLIGSVYNDSTTRSTLVIDSSGLMATHTWSSVSDYDIWCTYTKTTD